MSVKSKPKRRGARQGRTRKWKKAIVQVRAGRHDPDLPGPAGPRGASAHADPQAQAHEPRTALRRRTRTSRRSRRPSPRSTLVEGLKKSGGRNAHGRKTVAPPRRRRQAPVPQDRLQAPQGRRARRKRRRDRVRPQPHRPTSRCCTTPTARRRYILAPARLHGRHDGHVRRGRRHRGRQLPAAGAACRSARSSTTSSCSPAAAASSAAPPALGIQLMAKDGDMATLRLPSGEMRLVRAECRAHRRHDRQRRSPERQGRQGRPQAPHGRAPADARHGDEPGRPPARRRRGLDDRRPSPGHAVGRADARLPHAQEEQGVRPLHRARSPPWEGQER